MKPFRNLMNKSNTYKNMRKSKSIRAKEYFSFYIIYLLLIFITFTPIITSLSIKRKYFSDYYMRSHGHQIIIKINGTGTQNITSTLYTLCPNYVIHNTVNIKGTDCNKVDIPDNGNEINTLKLIWANANNFLAHIFENITNIVEVDLSTYDTTGVTDMRQMFLNCESLTSINFQYINTREVKDMRLMFSGCISLEHLDVSRFDTSQVTDFHFMFSVCK